MVVRAGAAMAGVAKGEVPGVGRAAEVKVVVQAVVGCTRPGAQVELEAAASAMVIKASAVEVGVGEMGEGSEVATVEVAAVVLAARQHPERVQRQTRSHRSQ